MPLKTMAARNEGKVVLLTLARAPWVSESCKNFYPSVGRLITQLKIPIVYAQEGIQARHSWWCSKCDSN